MRVGLGSVVGVFAFVLHGCQEPAQCAATGGEWNDCASVEAWCVDGEVKPNDQDRLAVCEQGCSCPDDAPVWDAEAGCVTAATCVDRGGSER